MNLSRIYRHRDPLQGSLFRKHSVIYFVTSLPGLRLLLNLLSPSRSPEVPVKNCYRSATAPLLSVNKCCAECQPPLSQFKQSIVNLSRKHVNKINQHYLQLNGYKEHFPYRKNHQILRDLERFSFRSMAQSTATNIAHISSVQFVPLMEPRAHRFEKAVCVVRAVPRHA